VFFEASCEKYQEVLISGTGQTYFKAYFLLNFACLLKGG